MSLNDLASEYYENSKAHGFYDDLQYHQSIEAMRSYEGNKMMLIAGEVAEAHEELRDGKTDIYYNVDGPKPDKPEGVPAELADIIIRVLDYCGWKKIDIEEAVRLKAEYNRTRPYKHGRLF